MSITCAIARNKRCWAGRARRLGPGAPFVAGAFIEHQSGRHCRALSKTNRLHCQLRWHPDYLPDCSSARPVCERKAAIYQAVCRGYSQVLAFELGPMFAANGEILTEKRSAA